MKCEVSNIMESEERFSEIFRFILISFALIVLESSGIFLCV
jgi:hypothetical protein